MTLPLDPEKLQRAVREARQLASDRIVGALSPLTYASWRDELLALQRRDGRLEYEIDSRVPLGHVETRNAEERGAESKRLCDCRATRNAQGD